MRIVVIDSAICVACLLPKARWARTPVGAVHDFSNILRPLILKIDGLVKECYGFVGWQRDTTNFCKEAKPRDARLNPRAPRDPLVIHQKTFATEKRFGSGISCLQCRQRLWGLVKDS